MARLSRPILGLLLSAVASSAAAQERFVGFMAYEGRPAPPGQQLNIGETVIDVQESFLELTVAADGTVTGTGRLVMSRTGPGTPRCADYAIRTLSLSGTVGKQGLEFLNGGAGVQAGILSGTFNYETRATKIGEAISDCNFGARSGSGLMGYLTNEPGFAAGSGSARVTDRFFILYDGYAQRGLSQDLEKSLRLNPENFGEHVVGVLSSTSGLVNVASPVDTEEGPVVIRLDYDGVVPRVIPGRGDERDATLGGSIRQDEVLLVEEGAFVVLQFADGTTLAVRPGAYFTSYPATLKPEARIRRIPMRLPNGRYGFLVPDSRYGVFYHPPTVGDRVRTVMQDGADIMYKLGSGLHDFLVAPPREPGDRFKAETNSVSTGVRGTVFRMVDDGVTTTVQVVEGQVSVSPKGAGLAGVQLAAGLQVRVSLSEVGPVQPYALDAQQRDVLDVLTTAVEAVTSAARPSVASAPVAQSPTVPADRGEGTAQVPEVPLPDLSTPEARRRALVDARATLGKILGDARTGRTLMVPTPDPPGFLPVLRATLRIYFDSQIASGAMTAATAQQIERQWAAGHESALAAAEREFAELGVLISSAGSTAPAPSAPSAVDRLTGSILSTWRACDGRTVTFAQEGAEIVGRYTAIGGLPPSLFSVGQVSHRVTQKGSGTYQGVVEHRFFDGRREWRDTVVTINGDRYRDTGSDACSMDMTRVPDAVAAGAGGVGPPNAGASGPVAAGRPAALAHCSILVGDWRRNDGMVVRMSAAGNGYRGVIVDPGAAAAVFRSGEHTFTVDAAPQPGVCTGQVLFRFADGRSEWRATRAAFTQPNVFDTDNAGQWSRVASGTTPVVPGPGPVPVARGCVDLSGRWSHTTVDVGSSVFTLSRRQDGQYDVTETGLGNSRGIAALSSNRLRYDFTWSGGAGFIEVLLNTDCSEGWGTLQFTAGRTDWSFTTLVRTGGAVEGGRSETPAVAWFAGTWDVESDGVRYGLDLTQDGNRVTGSYGNSQGAVEGTVTGQVLTLRWQHASGRRGTASLTLSTDRARFDGTYDAEPSAGLPASRGAWSGVRRTRRPD